MSEDGHCRSPEWHPKGADKKVYAGEVVKVVDSSGGSFAPKRFKRPRRKGYDSQEILAGLQAGDRTLLARGITCVESEERTHREIAKSLLALSLPHSGKSIRVGITGVPGAGKSQFIECLGKQLCEEGYRVAVLAVDPSSTVTGGSILGDKTRMEDLSRDLRAFIRPSPSSCTLGGVAAKTRESIVLCEAAGYDVVLVETVGVGQSEVAVRSMVDFFLLVQIAGAGDDLQGIKKGVVEMADAIVVNKADGDNVNRARLATVEYSRVLHYLHPFTEGWTPRALSCSALEGTGVGDVWDTVVEFCDKLKSEDRFDSIRAEQSVKWLRSLLEARLLEAFYSDDKNATKLASLEKDVSNKSIAVVEALDQLME